MNPQAEAAVRLLYSHYAALLEGAPVDDPDHMVATMGRPNPWWGVKEIKSKKGQKSLDWNRLGSGMGLLADQDKLIVFLRPGHLLPEWKREYTPVGRPAPSVRRHVVLSVEDGMVTVKKKKIPEEEARAFFADLQIPCAEYVSLEGIRNAIIMGTFPVKPPFVFVSGLTNSLPKCANAFGLSSVGSLHDCMGIRAEIRDSHRIRNSLVDYTQLTPEHRDIVANLIKTKQAMDLPSPARAWYARLPSTPADRKFVFQHISQGERHATA